MKQSWIIVGLLALVLFGGALLFSSDTAVNHEASNADVVVKDHYKGATDATVTLVEYSDFQCPACAQSLPVINEIMTQYGDSVSLEYRHFPLPMHTHATAAAIAAEAAGQQDAFFAYHDILFEKQGEWSDSVVTPTKQFVAYAEELGLDTERFRRHLDSSLLAEQVEADFIAGQAANVNQTPSFFLDGELLEFETFAALRAAVAAAVVTATTSTGTATTNIDT